MIIPSTILVPHHVIIFHRLLQRMNETSQTTIRHRQIIDFPAKYEFIMKTTKSRLLCVRFLIKQGYIHIIQIDIHIENVFGLDTGLCADQLNKFLVVILANRNRFLLLLQLLLVIFVQVFGIL